MDKLAQLSQDKELLGLIKDYFNQSIQNKIIAKVLAKEDVSGYGEANEIIKSVLREIDKLSEKDKPNERKNQSE